MKLIDKNEIYEYLDNLHFTEYKKYKVLQAVKDAPTIDAVPVVRCRDCIYWKQFRRVPEVGQCMNKQWTYLTKHLAVAFETWESDFCNYAKEKGAIE